MGLSLPGAVLAPVFLFLSGLHVYWALGGKWGWGKAIPLKDGRPLFQPGPVGTLAVAAALLGAAALVLWWDIRPQAGPSWIPAMGVRILAGVFAFRAVGDFRYCGFFKKVRGTAFARLDTFVYSPLCAAISGLALWLALGD